MASEQSTNELIHRLVTGQESAVKDIYDLYFDRICRVFGGQRGPRLNARMGASDLAQSILITFVGRAESLLREETDGGVLWRLICGIAVNKLKERRRHALREKRDARKEHIAASDDRGFDWIESPGPSPDELADLADSVDLVAGRLREFDREVFQRLVEGEHPAAIADRLECSYWKVNRSISRIRDTAETVFLASEQDSG